MATMLNGVPSPKDLGASLKSGSSAKLVAQVAGGALARALGGTTAVSSSQSSGYSSSLGSGLRATDDARANMVAAQEFNAAEAAKQRQWNEYMSNTSWQRTVKDMIAAGINPIYAVQAGTNSYSSGASASSGIAGAYTDMESANQSSSHTEDAMASALVGLTGAIVNMIGEFFGSGSAQGVSDKAKNLGSNYVNYMKSGGLPGYLYRKVKDSVSKKVNAEVKGASHKF